MDDHVPWEGKCDAAVVAFARQCVELKQSNPYQLAPLESIFNTLMTELWDNGFSQSEIRSAFEIALRDMPRYTVGQEIRR